MRKIKIGKSGVEATVVALGTWAIGGGERWGDNDDSESEKTIRAAVEQGINLIDTAPAYGKGHSETVIGRALRGIRSKVNISTKCGLVWDGRDGTFFFEHNGVVTRKNLSPRSVITDCEQSLKRLNTDHIDIYFTHWQSVLPYFTPIEETMEALQKLKRQGKIRAIGASNVDSEHIREYIKCGGIDIIQQKYSIIDREAEKEIIPLCKENGITFQAYSPLEMGLLTGKIKKDFVPRKDSAREGKFWFEKTRLPMVVDMLGGWEDICKKYDASITRIVIAFTAGRFENMNVLCGARKISQLEDNIKGGDILLQKQDEERMLRDIINLENKVK